MFRTSPDTNKDKKKLYWFRSDTHTHICSSYTHTDTHTHICSSYTQTHTHTHTQTHTHTPCPDRMVKTVWMQWRHSRLVRSCRSYQDNQSINRAVSVTRSSLLKGADSRWILTPDWIRLCSTLSRSSKNSRLIRWAKLTGSDITIIYTVLLCVCVCVCVCVSVILGQSL